MFKAMQYRFNFGIFMGYLGRFNRAAKSLNAEKAEALLEKTVSYERKAMRLSEHAGIFSATIPGLRKGRNIIEKLYYEYREDPSSLKRLLSKD